MIDGWLEATITVIGSLSLLGWARGSLLTIAEKYAKYDEEKR